MDCKVGITFQPYIRYIMFFILHSFLRTPHFVTVFFECCLFKISTINGLNPHSSFCKRMASQGTQKNDLYQIPRQNILVSLNLFYCVSQLSYFQQDVCLQLAILNCETPFYSCYGAPCIQRTGKARFMCGLGLCIKDQGSRRPL